MFSRFFIDRPIFASVVSIIIFLAGLIAMNNLPVAQYPDLTPPTVMVTASYPGASAAVISETVSSQLEQKINGVDDMIYMTSTSSCNGDSKTVVYFKVGTDPDQATINVNNRVQMVMAKLPEVVRKYGVTVQKSSTSMLQAIALCSDEDKYNDTYLGSYATVNIIDELKRISGIGDANVMSGNEYAIRIWLKPDLLAKLKITTSDIIAAISSQNTQRSIGKIGCEPLSIKSDKSFSVVAQGRFTNVSQFKEIIIRTNSNGASIKLKDIADIELGAQNYEIVAKTQGRSAVPIVVYLAPGANALSAADAVSKKMEELSHKFPKGIYSKVMYDTSGFVKNSIREVVKTLLEAIALVFLVIYVFLKNARATLIPSVVVPVSIIGAFAGMSLFGFSINILTLFGLVLAIGIVVDDAIVVIENVERLMKVEKLKLYDATVKAMEEVSGALVAIVLVLCAVFVPVSFMGGLVGTMYKQFAITIAVSVIISGIVALTLTPALCVLLLKTEAHKENKFFKWFDSWFAKLVNLYVQIVAILIYKRKIAIFVVSSIFAVTVVLFMRVPGSLLPDEDQGVCFVTTILDPGSSLFRSKNVISNLETKVREDSSVTDFMTISGFNIMGGSMSNNTASAFVKLKDWSERKKPEQKSQSLAKKIYMIGMKVTNALVYAFCPPAIVGMSMNDGFEGFIQQTGDSDPKILETKTKEFVGVLLKRKELQNISTTFNASSPQFSLDVDISKVLSYGVNIEELYNTAAATLGSFYVNDFSKYGRSFKVIVQARGDYRLYPEKISEMYIRTIKGSMIPLTTLVKLNSTVGADNLDRFNCFPAAKIMGTPAEGYSSGQALSVVDEVAKQVLGEGYLFSWVGSAYQEKITGGTSHIALLLGLLVVFLILAAQYEQWSLPCAVILSVPFSIFGALLSVILRDFTNDIYFQIALITLIGLSAKNAILIVEFANMLHKEGSTIVNAAIKAAQLRFRPIIMTSLAFILGCVPLAISSGAGSASRQSLGTAVVGGMIGATVLAPIFVPMFYVVIMSISEKFFSSKKKKGEQGNV